MIRSRILPAFAAALLAAQAHAISFQFPLRCDYGHDCFIQNYADDGGRDYHCGTLTYPGHNGTDIRLRDFAAMRQGVDVLAAADGTVLRLRDNVPDTGMEDAATDLTNRECGNGVVVGHAEGYETQYCHMQQGSIRVKVGDAVKAGDALGHVGYSGDTQFPHLHFQVNHDGAVWDPFNAAVPFTQASCSMAHASLWRKTPDYIGTALLGIGINAAVPHDDWVDAPLLPQAQAPASAPILILWVRIMGAQAGDVLRLTLQDAGGHAITTRDVAVVHHRAVMFEYIGKKFHAPLAPGIYRGEAVLLRQGVAVPNVSGHTSITITKA